MEKLLFAVSEAYPLIKTGGLADVAGSLPEVLRQKGLDVRLLLPAYGDLLANLETPPETLVELELAGEVVHILETHLPGTQLITWLVDHPMFSQRSGNRFMARSRYLAETAAQCHGPEFFLATKCRPLPGAIPLRNRLMR